MFRLTLVEISRLFSWFLVWLLFSGSESLREKFAEDEVPASGDLTVVGDRRRNRT